MRRSPCRSQRRGLFNSLTSAHIHGLCFKRNLTRKGQDMEKKETSNVGFIFLLVGGLGFAAFCLVVGVLTARHNDKAMEQEAQQRDKAMEQEAQQRVEHPEDEPVDVGYGFTAKKGVIEEAAKKEGIDYQREVRRFHWNAWYRMQVDKSKDAIENAKKNGDLPPDVD
jgi:hypothetical protein